MGFFAHVTTPANSVNLFDGFKLTGNFTTVDLIAASTNSLDHERQRASDEQHRHADGRQDRTPENRGVPVRVRVSPYPGN